MTQREEAYELIRKLPDKVMGDVLKDLQEKDNDPKTWETPEQEAARKARELEESREAFRWLQEMRMKMREIRKENPSFVPDDYEEAYAESLEEKYGVAK